MKQICLNPDKVIQIQLLRKYFFTSVPFLLDVTEWEPDIVGDFGCRVWCPDLLSEGQWHHLVVTLNRAVLKNSSLSVYIDGQPINQQKVNIVLIPPSVILTLLFSAALYSSKSRWRSC